MTTFRVHHSRRYTVIDNETLRDERLSLAAIGLLARLLSYPDDWEFNEKHLIANSKEGRHSIRAKLQELADAGYIKRGQSREQGKFGKPVLDVYERPFSGKNTVDRFSDDGFSDDGFSDDGKSNNILSNDQTKYRSVRSNEREQTASPTLAVVPDVIEPGTPERDRTTPDSEATALSVQPKGSGKGKNSAPRRQKTAPVDVEAWRDTYNRHKPDKWASCQTMNAARVKHVQRAIESYGDEGQALQMFAVALSHVRVSVPWWRERDFDFSAPFKKIDERLVAWAEAGCEAGLNPDAVAQSGMSDRQIQAARRDHEASNSKTGQLMREARRRQTEQAQALRARAQ